MASSLAFWFETKNEHNRRYLNDIDTELHFNYWSLKSTNTNYLDIGVHITSKNAALQRNVTKLKIFLPFKESELKFDFNLGGLICDDKTLLAAIFNSHILSTRSEDSSGVLNITLPDGNVFDFYTHIEVVSDDGMLGVEIHSFKDEKQPGTILTIPVELITKKHQNSSSHTEKKPFFLLKNQQLNDMAGNVSYFRFRVKLSKRENSISTLFQPKASFITSQFEETQIIDFRVNEARILPLKIREQMQDARKLTKIHFFLVREASAEYKAAHSEFKRCRILESEIWDKYLGHENDTQKQPMLIYHWSDYGKPSKDGKTKQPIDHFSAFSKFSSTTVTDKKILVMVVILITLGVVSGIIANKVWQEWTTAQAKHHASETSGSILQRHSYVQQYDFPTFGKSDNTVNTTLPSKGGSDG
ncbi:hypothetical protein FLM11_11380 [Vibrio cholerae]|uniref:hypothetical protein n=1 Tax=Vibrio cholerae TaxID=666 RepID=UPI00115752E8|nr:hypothetical protein [Vibrio cholerae]TQO98951.1 hypothetical protein FLM11_11380 [Vibrio cholerae]